MRLSVILPAYNEAATVGSVIDQVLAQDLSPLETELIIVESHSTDGTRDIVSQYADHPQVQLVFEDAPGGKGRAVRLGLQRASGDLILIQDGDLEYRIDEYPIVLAPLLAGEASFVLGCRHTPGKAMRALPESHLKSTLMNGAHWAFTGMFNVVYGTKLRDPFTMYKVFRRSCIDGVEFTANRFDFDWELVAKLVRLGHRPVEVPITYESRGFASGKKVRFFKDPMTWMVALVRYRFAPLKSPAAAPATDAMDAESA
ncbi:MAG TPA: glycosyltransferase family 2 protein [Actinomycetota bacterium]|nr:glycosyltransferase family 2 protein [Actinomycetota bacterium]